MTKVTRLHPKTKAATRDIAAPASPAAQYLDGTHRNQKLIQQLLELSRDIEIARAAAHVCGRAIDDLNTDSCPEIADVLNSAVDNALCGVNERLEKLIAEVQP